MHDRQQLKQVGRVGALRLDKLARLEGDGVERARMLGEADWGGKDAAAVLDRLLEEK